MYRYHFIVGITFNPTSYTTIARRKRASECATQTHTYDSEFKVIIFGFDQNILLKAFQIYTYIYIGPYSENSMNKNTKNRHRHPHMTVTIIVQHMYDAHWNTASG